MFCFLQLTQPSLGVRLATVVPIQVIQWLRLAFSNGLNWVDAPPPPHFLSPEDEDRPSSQNAVF
jgi:hypothetical protein